ncbi:MAG: fumarylacetoacetate hydrolase family protein [Bryobacteraceae bacterium]|jgi:2-keto-4-pentenoate hydratase/2-oxohepta-3-ene-1,7-dioic acid hydratase in catechol pathway
MRFVTLQREGYAEPGVLWGGELIGIGGAGFDSVLSVIAGGADAMDRVGRWLKNPPPGEPFDPARTRLPAPVPRPPKIVCIGLNYRDHAAESNLPIPDTPTVFAKFQTAVTGHRHPIVLPKSSAKPDYEAEFAVVIGQGGRHIPEERWREHVFGYTIANDVSARDFQMATTQWMIGKTFDTFAPIGPAIVTADEIADPHNLAISLTISGEVLQSSNTRHLIFGVPKLIAYLSSVFTLEPGDIISTGTPAGVGFARKPPRWLKPGDEVVVRVEGLGELVNPVVAEG